MFFCGVVESSSLDFEACGSIPNAPKFTCAEFGAKRFVLVRDMAANVMYYMMGKSGSVQADSLIQYSPTGCTRSLQKGCKPW